MFANKCHHKLCILRGSTSWISLLTPFQNPWLAPWHSSGSCCGTLLLLLNIKILTLWQHICNNISCLLYLHWPVIYSSGPPSLQSLKSCLLDNGWQRGCVRAPNNFWAKINLGEDICLCFHYSIHLSSATIEQIWKKIQVCDNGCVNLSGLGKIYAKLPPV